jgi:hypothetical protein
MRRLIGTEKTIQEGLENLAKSMDLGNHELIEKTALAKGPQLPEFGVAPLDLAFNKCLNSVPNLVLAINFLFNQNKELEKRMDQVENKAEKLDLKKTDKTDVDERFDQLIRGVDQKTESNSSDLGSKMEELDRRVTELVSGTKRRIGEVEVATLWRIQDCEELVKSRATEKYVQDALRNLEESMRDEVWPLICFRDS